MKPTATAAAPGVAPALHAQPASADWLRLLIVCVAVLLPLLLYADTALSIEDIWRRSETYAHDYMVLPICVWLVWRQRDRLRPLPLRPCWPALAGLLLCGGAWLAGALGEVQVVRQYALAAMLPLAALAMLGLPMARAITFPLLFVLFAVPVGESLIPPLVNLTANFTTNAIRWSGIPVLQEGNRISLPTGDWSVVEACSGLRYLISSITLGCLYAHLTYRSRLRQALFVLAAILLPVLANGLRAYMIVMIGHLSDMSMAVGVDHLIYGWVFFGMVMLLLFWLGGLWRESDAEPARSDAPPGPRAPASRLGAAALGVACCVGIWPAFVAQMEHSGAALAPIVLDHYRPALPPAPAFTDWQPDYATPTASRRAFFAQEQGQVGLQLLYYRDLPGGPKLISSSNHLTVFNGPWNELGEVVRSGPLAGSEVRETRLVSKGQSLLVWRWYLIGNAQTASDYRGKVLQARQKMLTGCSEGVVVMIFSSYNESPDTARAALSRFMLDDGATLQRTLAGCRPR